MKRLLISLAAAAVFAATASATVTRDPVQDAWLRYQARETAVRIFAQLGAADVPLPRFQDVRVPGYATPGSAWGGRLVEVSDFQR